MYTQKLAKRIVANSKLVEKSIEPNSKIVITPHIGGMTIEGQTKAYHYAINKFRGKNEND